MRTKPWVICSLEPVIRALLENGLSLGSWRFVVLVQCFWLSVSRGDHFCHRTQIRHFTHKSLILKSKDETFIGHLRHWLWSAGNECLWVSIFWTEVHTAWACLDEVSIFRVKMLFLERSCCWQSGTERAGSGLRIGQGPTLARRDSLDAMCLWERRRRKRRRGRKHGARGHAEVLMFKHPWR